MDKMPPYHNICQTHLLEPCAQPKRQLSNVPGFGEEAASLPDSPAVVMTHTGSQDDPEVWRPPTPVWPADDYADSPQPYTVSLSHFSTHRMHHCAVCLTHLHYAHDGLAHPVGAYD